MMHLSCTVSRTFQTYRNSCTALLLRSCRRRSNFCYTHNNNYILCASVPSLRVRVSPQRRNLYGRNKQKALGHKVHRQKGMESDDGWITVGDDRIHAWAVSGIESCVVAHVDGTYLAFDMGYPTRPSVRCAHVFLSHGHIDHVAGVVKHSANRCLYSLSPATYYCPPHMEEPLRQMAASLGRLHGSDEKFSNINIQTMSPGESVQVNKSLTVVAFPTEHRVTSQGYLVYKTSNLLKAEYQELAGPRIGELVKANVQIREAVTTPQLAYTGDTKFDVFTSPPIPDLLKVCTLITEMTYIDDEKDRKGRGGLQRARDWGHTHIQELIDNAELFKHVAHIMLVHFSDKYSVRYIERRTRELLPESLRNKVVLGTLMKQTFG